MHVANLTLFTNAAARVCKVVEVDALPRGGQIDFLRAQFHARRGHGAARLTDAEAVALEEDWLEQVLPVPAPARLRTSGGGGSETVRGVFSAPGTRAPPLSYSSPYHSPYCTACSAVAPPSPPSLLFLLSARARRLTPRRARLPRQTQQERDRDQEMGLGGGARRFERELDVVGEGTQADMLLGLVMGFVFGIIMLFWIWERGIPRRQKLGILCVPLFPPRRRLLSPRHAEPPRGGPG